LGRMGINHKMLKVTKTDIVVGAVACAVTETKCPLYSAFFFFFLFSANVTFLPVRVIVGVRNFAWGFKSQKYMIWGKKEFRVSPCPRGLIF
jgi:hypothetical protein